MIRNSILMLGSTSRWRTCHWRGYGPAVRQNTEWKN